MSHLAMLDTLVGNFGYLLTLAVVLAGIAYLQAELWGFQFRINGLTLQEQGQRIDNLFEKLEAQRERVLTLRRAARAARLDAAVRRRSYVPEWDRVEYDQPALTLLSELTVRELRTFRGIGKVRSQRIRAEGNLTREVLRKICGPKLAEGLLDNLAMGVRGVQACS